MTRDDAQELVSVRKHRNVSWIRTPLFASTLGEAISLARRTDRAAIYVTDEPAATGELVGQLAAQGWHVSAEQATPTLRHDGVTIRYLTPWVGRACSTGEAATWHVALANALGRLSPGARPFGSPGTLGRDLWLRTLPESARYPVMGERSRDLVRSIAGQGRFEMFHYRDSLPQIVEYDARLAYLGCASTLPIGEPIMSHSEVATGGQLLDRIGPFSPGWARVRWSAPSDWGERPGILTSRECRDDAGRSTWPVEGAGWCSLVSIRCAVTHGWQVQTHGPVMYWPAEKPTIGRPLSKLLGLCRAEMDNPPSDVARDVWRSTWRAIALHTIGAFYAAPRRSTHYGPIDGPVPGRAHDVQMMPARRVVRWHELSSALWPETHHPEWSGAIWERARVRLLDAPGVGERVGALHLPPGSVIGFRTDAIYVDRDPSWTDDGKIGRHRHRRTADGPMVAPTTQAELLDVMAGQS